MGILVRLFGVAALAASLCAPARAADIFISTIGSGQAERTSLVNTRIRYDSEGQNAIVSGSYSFNTSELEFAGIQGGNCSFSSPNVIQVVASGTVDFDLCNVVFRARRVPYPRSSVFVGSAPANCFVNSFPSNTCSIRGGTAFNIIGPTISPGAGSSFTLTGSVGLAPQPAIVRITNTGVLNSVLAVTSSTSGSPATVSPSGTGTDLARLAFRDYTLSCSTATAGTFTRTVSFAHNATPNQGSPVNFTLTCRILNPPNLIYTPATGTAISIPGSIALGTTRQIDVRTSGGDPQGARSLSCSVSSLTPGYSVTVETSPFATGSAGRIRLGCDSNPVPGPADLRCTESGNSTTRIWPISCASDEAFTATPPFATPVVLNGLVGGPAPTATFVVTNTGTEGTVMTVQPPSGLSNPLSVVPATAQTINQGATGVSYTITCSTLAAFTGTQTLSLAHNAPGSPSQLSVTCNIRRPPNLLYAPSFGNSIQVSASVGGTTPTTPIAVTTTGGDPGGERSLACSANQPNYSVVVDSSPIATGGSATVRLGCDSINQQAATLTCTESPGGNPARQWQLTCANTAVYTSSPRPGSAIGVYYPIGETGSVDADVAVANKGTNTLSISGCVQSPSLFFGVSFIPNPIAGNSSGTLNVTCPTPALGSADFRTLSCSTNDPTRPSIVYKLICVAPPTTDSGEGASPGERLTSPTPDGGALLGSATVIARLDNGDEIVVVGAPSGGDDGDGRVYVYVRTRSPAAGGLLADGKRAGKGLGAPVAVLRAPANRGKAHAKGIGNKFGDGVAVSSDGTFIAVGAPTGGGANTGQVLLFEMPPGGWGELDDVMPTVIEPPADPGVVASDFGAHVEFAPDGMLVVGAPGAIVSAVDNAGAAFVFDPLGAPVGSPITATSPEQGAAFGTSLDVSGGMLAIGAPGEDNSSGAAYFFEMDAASVGPANRQTAPGGADFGDKWGTEVVIGGASIVVGAPNDDTAAGTDSGSATVFTMGEGNEVEFAATLVPPGGGTQGAGAALATNGDVVVVGAPFSDVNGNADRGRAIVYDLDAAAIGVGTPAGVYENSIGESGDQFGLALAISQARLLIGAPLSDEGPDVDEGRVDPFDLDRIFRGNFER